MITDTPEGNIEHSVPELNSKERILKRKQLVGQLNIGRLRWVIGAAFLIASLVLVIIRFGWEQRKEEASSIPEANSPVTIKVLKYQTSKALGELDIKLTDTQVDSTSQTYKVTAFISIPGQKTLEIREQEATPEITYTYPKSGAFKVKVISADTDSATFQVQRKKS